MGPPNGTEVPIQNDIMKLNKKNNEEVFCIIHRNTKSRFSIDLNVYFKKLVHCKRVLSTWRVKIVLF